VRKAVGAGDAGQRARFFDARHGDAQVAVVFQRGGDQGLQARIGESTRAIPFCRHATESPRSGWRRAGQASGTGAAGSLILRNE
jgi:hypothetical protein